MCNKVEHDKILSHITRHFGHFWTENLGNLTLTSGYIASGEIACVAGTKRRRGRGNLGAQERMGCTREKGKEPLPSSLARGLAP